MLMANSGSSGLGWMSVALFAVARQAPDEAGLAVGQRVDAVEVGGEIGDHRVVDGGAEAPDVDLGEVVAAHLVPPLRVQVFRLSR
jgi:hypothetical protein